MVGQVGLGIMGGAFAQHLLTARFGVIGFDPDTKARAAHAKRGGDCAASAAAVARQCSVIITSLPSVKAMETAFFGKEGIAAGAKKGTIVIEASTMPLEVKHDIRARCAELGITVLDCPISGTGAQAAAKDISVYASGDAAAAQDPLRIVFGGLTAGLALAVVIGTTVVGHSGAVAVWEKRINPAPAAPSHSATPTQDPSLVTSDDLAAHSSTTDCWTAIAGKVYDLTPWLVGHPGDTTIICGGTSSNADITVAELGMYEVGTLDTSTAAPGFTAAEVAQHSTATDCWSIVNGMVYDLTDWIPQHPGGPQVINAMCGKDGSAGFNGQHAGAQSPAEMLASYKLGPLK